MADFESLKPNGHSTMLVRLFQKMKSVFDNKVDKETGKGLSSEDYTSSEKTKLQGIESGAQVNTVTGVKGNSESSYRTGNVNITAANVGLGNVGNFKAVSTVANQNLTATEKSNARTNIGAGTSSFSGSYNDLTDKPTIPTVNNATLTIQKNGTNVKTFTANQSTNVTANITVPTKVSELTNDSGYTANTGTVTQVKIGTTAYNPSSGVVSLPAYPTDTNTRKSFFGTCATAAATATKDVTLSDTTGWELSAGTVVGVKFTYNNSASSVKLNVNGSGAKSIYFANAVYTGTSVQITGWANYIIYYMYDGTNWVFLNNSNNYTDSNNYVTQTNSSENYDFRVLFSQTADDTTRTQGARKSGNLTYNPSTDNLKVGNINGAPVGTSIEIPASGSGNALYFDMPDKSLWYGRHILLCAWRKNSYDKSQISPDFIFPLYVSSALTTDESEPFDVFGTHRDSTTILNPHVEIRIFGDEANQITFENNAIYCRTINNGNYLSADSAYLYLSLFDWLCVVT